MEAKEQRGATCPRCRRSFFVIVSPDPNPGLYGTRLEQTVSCWHCDHVFTIYV